MVDEQPAWIIARLPTVATAYDEATATKQEEAAQQAAKQQQVHGGG